MGVPLSTNLSDPTAVPYFLWDEPMTVAAFQQRIREAPIQEQDRLLGKLLREARDTDVWVFTTPQQVWQRWPRLVRYLGRRRGFWEFMFRRWRQEGLVAD